MQYECTNCLENIDALTATVDRIEQYAIIQTELVVFMAVLMFATSIFQLVALWVRRY
jgi:hypothetical protein